MVGVQEVVRRDGLEQFFFYGKYGCAFGEAGAVGDAEDVGVNGHGRFAEGGVQDDVGGFASDAGQAFQGFALVGDLRAVFVDEDAAGFEDVCGFVVVEADGVDVVF